MQRYTTITSGLTGASSWVRTAGLKLAKAQRSPSAPPWAWGAPLPAPSRDSQEVSCSQPRQAVNAPFMFWFISLCQMEVSHADGPNAPDEIYPPGSSCGTVEMKSWGSYVCASWGWGFREVEDMAGSSFFLPGRAQGNVTWWILTMKCWSLCWALLKIIAGSSL